MKKGQIIVASMLFAGAMSAQAVPMDYDFSGTFTQDNDVVLLNFTVSTSSTVTIFSSSWDDGGFDPIMALWDAAGNLIYEQDDGGMSGSQISNGVSYDYGNWDSYFTQLLSPGTYIASIAQYDNFAQGTTLADGFTYDGNPTFTQSMGSYPMFNGANGDQRTGDWSFHILNVDQANQVSVPEPASLALLGLALAGFGLRRRRAA